MHQNLYISTTPIGYWMHALLYEYEQDLEDLLSYWLQQDHFTLQVAKTREEFYRFCREGFPQLLILGTCPPHVLQSDVVEIIRSIPTVDQSHLMILTTNTLYCHRVTSENRKNTTCICTPTTPRLLKETLHGIRQMLEKPASGGKSQATASI